MADGFRSIYPLKRASDIDAEAEVDKNWAMKLVCESVPAIAFAEKPYRNPPIIAVQQVFVSLAENNATNFQLVLTVTALLLVPEYITVLLLVANCSRPMLSEPFEP